MTDQPTFQSTNTEPTKSQTPGSGLAIAALVIGLIAFLTGLVPLLGAFLGVIAIGLGIGALVKVSKGKAAGKGMAIAGLVLGAIALLVSMATTLFTGAVINEATKELDESGAEAAAEGTTENEAGSSVGVGEAARDGSFEFQVSSLECGISSVGEDFLNAEAQGQFCALNLSVSNIGDSAQSLLADNQYLIGADGAQYSADSTATLYNSPSDDTWFTEINPGNSVEGAIIFDVPADADIAKAELHDSMYSGGIEVNLK